MMIQKCLRIAMCVLAIFSSWPIGGAATAENQGQMVRLARLVIDPAKLEAYKAALKEEIEASVRLEPGVLTLYAVSEKQRPTHFTILEIYASQSAYEAHIKSAAFPQVQDRNGRNGDLVGADRHGPTRARHEDQVNCEVTFFPPSR